MPSLVASLPDGPLDIIGDVHGELDALHQLLYRLGCDTEALTAPRHLVFVGDLIDRGPDSWGVLTLVRRLVQAGLATCVLGNHEINAILGLHKQGNGWLFGHEDLWAERTEHGPVFREYASRRAPLGATAEMLEWLATLPLVAERDDLRVVHACYDAQALAALPASDDIAALFREHGQRIVDTHRSSGLLAAAQEELRELGGQSRPEPPILAAPPAATELSLALQNDHPLRVLTSGLERPLAPTQAPFYVGGKWRFVRRDPWWERYDAAPAVVMGHYWRSRGPTPPGEVEHLMGSSPFHWVGGGGGVFCVDYSVGRRFVQRAHGQTRDFEAGLAALRWPERTLVFDDRDGEQPTYRGA